ncbi:hypothetical protein MBLNU459_g0340t1 [Dothideomycetes sp. NU459]
MGSGSPDFSQESSLLCGFEDDSRDISFHEFEVMVRQAYPNAQSPSTWTSPPGVLTPTSSLDPQRERSDFNDANSFSHQFMPVQTQDELLRSLAPTSPSMSLATSFEISEDELPQDEQLRATHGTVLQQQSYQQSYQTANETLVDGMFSGQNRNFNLSAEAYSNNVIQAFVQRNMMTELDNTILVHLTIGCGRSLALPLYEFRPTSDEFLYTFAYMADGQGGWHRRRKRSPPLAIKHSTKADKALLTAFVTDMVTNYLEDFKEMTCDGEDAFLPDLLKLLCDLYIGLGSSPQNKTLRDDLHVVLMIIVLTHIICHAITIDEGAKEAVISQLSRDNDPRLYEDWTSPRMANSQLKQVFGEIRDELLIKVLNRLHQILRSAKDKNRTWLSSFIIMLGIAMVSEEYQHLLHIQADRYISRGESTEDDAMRHARQGCTQIDEGFKFLQQLFHYKYRPKHQKKARFTDWSHKTFDPADTTFVHCFEDAVTFRAEYLRSRKDLNIYSMTEGNHTSRLVSRFLADFMDLEPNSP